MKHPIRTLMGAATMTFDAAVPHVHDGRRCHVCPKGIRYRFVKLRLKGMARHLGDDSLAHILEPMREATKALSLETEGICLPHDPQYWITMPIPSTEGDNPYGKFWILTQADTERIESLGVMLGVPGLHEEGCLRYCVGNQQMLDLVLQICKRPKVEVTALERAAVLESMFVW